MRAIPGSRGKINVLLEGWAPQGSRRPRILKPDRYRVFYEDGILGRWLFLLSLFISNMLEISHLLRASCWQGGVEGGRQRFLLISPGSDYAKQRVPSPQSLGHGQPRNWGPGALWNANKDPVPVSWLDELSLTLQLKCHFYQEAPPTPAQWASLILCPHGSTCPSPSNMLHSCHDLLIIVNCAAPISHITVSFLGMEVRVSLESLNPSQSLTYGRGSVSIDWLAVDDHLHRT